jgi:RHS repeat-associated protein
MPSITLPKGGGAIRGMGEKFAGNPVMGTGSMSVPIATSPGRSGFGPQLSLSYDSSSGNGPFGFGWSLDLPAITRKTDKGLPQYRDADESDVYILSGAEDLVPVLLPNGRRFKDDTTAPGYTIHHYRPRVEGLFARVERWTNIATGEIHWRSITRDNVTTLYGKDNNSRIFDPADPMPGFPTHTFSWLICGSYDDRGNAIIYEYVEENDENVDRTQANERNRMRRANRYVKRIKYGNRTPNRDAGSWQATDPGQLPNETWMFEVVFDYGEGHYTEDAPDAQNRIFATAQINPQAASPWPVRQDPFSTYRAGYEVRTYRLLRRVLIFHHFPQELGINDCLVRSTEFSYFESPVTSSISSVAQSGYVRQPVQSRPNRYLKKSLPPLEFEYSHVPNSEELAQQPIREVDAESLENLPVGLDGASYQWMDLDGDGTWGILTEQADAWYYKRNLSPIARVLEDGHQHTVARFGGSEVVARKPAAGLAGGGQFLDLAGDGQVDLVEMEGPMPGLYERTDDADWSPFQPFASWPNLSTRDPDQRLVDLTGDGHADIMISEGEGLTWYPSLGEAGFGPAARVSLPVDEEKGPRLVFSDGLQSIYLADLSGDGLSDLVRLRNGEVCYWPNLGYGRFGPKVTMDNAPWFDNPDQFDQRRIRLADTDGSGTTDILYLRRDGAHIYFNQSGNRWSDAIALPQFPASDTISSVQALDLLGNGTACLVWSSQLPGVARQPMRYLALMDKKPHLLVRVKNNLGAETKVHYAPSTRFSVQDKRDGKPWITRLPFPVHVVERVETHDLISRNRFVTRYAYHHGYFDGVEREFRGFGMVEQFDTEELAALTESGDFPGATNLDAASFVPTVLTKTWFHTGAFIAGERISRHFEGEYYHEGNDGEGGSGLTDKQLEALLMLLPDTELPATLKRLDGSSVPWELTAEEKQEACRALKGSILRREIYALDGTDDENRPYSATEQSYTIELLQPRSDNKHAVFLAHPRESIDFLYERKLFKVGGVQRADPRVTHAMTLEVDGYGNALKSVAIGYGRRPGLSPLQDGDKAKQEQLLITYTENAVTNPIDEPHDYRTPLPCEARTYELLNLRPDSNLPGITNLFGFNEMVAKAEQASDGGHDLPYEDIYAAGATANHPYRRLIEHVRTLYRRNDLAGALPLAESESLAIAFESYKLAFTPGLLDQLYVRSGQRLLPVNPAEVLEGGGAARGGYVDLDGDGNWWIPAGRIFFSPGTVDTPAVELAYARTHFFLPHRSRTPFHTDQFNTEAVLTFDVHNLLLIEAHDARGNVVTVSTRDDNGTIAICNDYRVLQPYWITDPNRNRTRVEFDGLGMVVATVVMGKPGDNQGDNLVNFEADLTQTQIDAFSDAPDPHSLAMDLLKGASTRIVYDPHRFRLSQQAHPEDSTQWKPPYAASMRRETHASDSLPPQGLKIQINFSYSDGFGREIQKKVQAEPGPVVEGGPVVNPRWVGSGWTIFNNKGKPVRQYEPFFDDTHSYKFGVAVGVSPVLFYDPVGRLVATLHPNHTWEKVVFDPWQQTAYDVNDTVTFDPRTDAGVKEFFKRLPDEDYLPTWYALRTDPAQAAEANLTWPDPKRRDAEKDAATKAAKYADTPGVAHFDSRGRPFLTIAHNKFDRRKPDDTLETIEETYSTRVEVDIEGNLRAVRDALDRIVMHYDYDLLGNRIHQASMEAGERWILSDVAGKPLYAWDSRDHQFRTEYDELRRPNDSFLRASGEPAILVGRTVYGESQPHPEAKNQRGKPVQLFDQGGVVTTGEYDFKGNLLQSRRQLARNYKAKLDWLASPGLAQETFISSTTYDALNRPIQIIAPHAGDTVDVMQPVYNEANLLEKLDGWLKRPEPAKILAPGSADQHFVTNLDYDAKGQRLLVEYGNRVKTEYAYDPLTLRLTNLRTTRLTGQSRLQDLSYAYDPGGNLTQIQDGAQQTIYFNNQVVTPDNHYTYDSVYRLINAEGREHIGQALQPQTTWDDQFRRHLPQPGDGQSMRPYREEYRYDQVGNFLQLMHQAAQGNWTRSYAYNEPSQIEPGKQNNRLSSTTIGGANPLTEAYTYDAHGNMTAMPHLTLMQSNYQDQLQATARQVVAEGSGTPETTYYVYDAAGQRARKVTERQNGTRRNERIYLGGFEIYREYDGGGNGVTLERETLQVMDDKQRIALVETRTHDTAGTDTAPAQLCRYQFGNHLGSASLELDDTGQIISYEEYYPYGSTSYQAMGNQTESPKRYRYTGMERDEETGLNYHGARYYAPWLGRWVSSDPRGLVDGTNLYRYAHNNPLGLTDTGGTEPVRPLGGPFATSEHYKGDNGEQLVDKPGLVMAGKSTKNLTSVTINNLDEGQTELSTIDAVHSSTQYVDNGAVSVGAEIDNLAYLRIKTLRFRYPNKPDVQIPISAINFTSGGMALDFFKYQGVIYPVSPNGEVAFNQINTPNLVAGARMKLGDRLTVLAQREQIAWTVYAFAGAISQLGGYASSMGSIHSLGFSIGRILPSRSPKGLGIGASPGGGKGSKFSGGSAGFRDCVYCVTSLIDAFENEGFVQPGSDYPQIAEKPGAPAFPTADSALNYIKAQTGVDFEPGKYRNRMGSEGYYVVFNNFLDGKPGHILWARVRGNGQINFYDPQKMNINVQPGQVGPFEAYKQK